MTSIWLFAAAEHICNIVINANSTVNLVTQFPYNISRGRRAKWFFLRKSIDHKLIDVMYSCRRVSLPNRIWRRFLARDLAVNQWTKKWISCHNVIEFEEFADDAGIHLSEIIEPSDEADYIDTCKMAYFSSGCEARRFLTRNQQHVLFSWCFFLFMICICAANRERKRTN